MKKEMMLKVTSLNRGEVFLSWNSVGNTRTAESVTGSAYVYMQPEKYQVKVNGEKVASITGSAYEYSYQFSVPSPYETCEYQICYVDETGDETSYSNVVSFTNIKTITRSIETDTIWGENVGSYEVTKAISVARDATLYIKPGTVVKFAEKSFLHVYGKITMDGDENNEVILTSMGDLEHEGVSWGNNCWIGVCVCDGGYLYAEHTRFLDMMGGKYYFGNSYNNDYRSSHFGLLVYGMADISNCDIEVEENQAIGVADGGSLLLENCSISGGTKYSIYGEKCEKLEIKGCLLQGGNYGIYAWEMGNTQFKISETTISEFTNCGVYLDMREGSSVEMDGCTIIGTGYRGVSLNSYNDASITMKNNIVNGSYSYGVRVNNEDSSLVEISGCTVDGSIKFGIDVNGADAAGYTFAAGLGKAKRQKAQRNVNRAKSRRTCGNAALDVAVDSLHNLLSLTRGVNV